MKFVVTNLIADYFIRRYIRDSILGLSFEISASSFYQVNPIQVEKLYRTAINLLNADKNQVVLDAYSGVGTIGMSLSDIAKNILCIENNASSNKAAIINSKLNNITNVRFINNWFVNEEGWNMKHKEFQRHVSDIEDSKRIKKKLQKKKLNLLR